MKNPRMGPKPLSESDCKTAYSVAAEQIKNLRDAVIVRKNMAAAERLIALAAESVRAVHALWNDPQESVFPHLARIDLHERREMLRALSVTKHPFPCLHFWKESKWPACRARQATAIDSIRAGPFKARGLHKKGGHVYLGRLLRNEVYRAFRKIQRSHRVRSGLNRRIQLLPPLAMEFRHLWTVAIKEWIWENKRSEIFTKGTALYNLCRADDNFNKRAGRKRTRLNDRKDEHVQAEYPEPKVGLRLEMRGFQIDKQATERRPSDGDFKDGLYLAILKRLETSLAQR